MERSRENSKRRGVSRCWSVFGGTSGPEKGTLRAVGRCRCYTHTLVSQQKERKKTQRGGVITGSSVSVSVSPAQSSPGVVHIGFGWFLE